MGIQEFPDCDAMSQPNCFVNNQNTPRVQRQAVLHLVHPDTFEGTVSVRPQEANLSNAKAFARFVTEQTADVDRKIMHIRRGLEAELGRDFDFYDPDIYRPAGHSSQPSLWRKFVSAGPGVCRHRESGKTGN